MTSVHDELINLLKLKNIEHKIINHKPTTTSEESAKVRGTALNEGAKCLLLTNKEEYVIVVLPADCELVSKKVKKHLKWKNLRFADEDEFSKKTKLTKGALPPFGDLFGIKMLVDEKFLKNELMAFNAASLENSVLMKIGRGSNISPSSVEWILIHPSEKEHVQQLVNDKETFPKNISFENNELKNYFINLVHLSSEEEMDMIFLHSFKLIELYARDSDKFVLDEKLKIPALHCTSRKKKKTETKVIEISEENKSEEDLLLQEVFDSVSKSLKILEEFIESDLKTTVPWSNNQQLELFTQVYNICTSSPDCSYFEIELYKNFSNYINEYLSDRILPKIQNQKNEEQMLEESVKNWKNFKEIFLKFSIKIYQYLDRYYVHIENKRFLKEEGYHLYFEIIFQKLKNQMRNIILNKIEQDRNGIQINRSLLNHSINIFIDMKSCGEENEDVYFEEFEKHIITETKNYYKQEASKWISELDLTDYLKQAEKKLKQEYTRLNQIFQGQTRSKLMKICDIELLLEKQNHLFESNSDSIVEKLIINENFEDLYRLYNLMSRVENGITPVTEIFKNYIQKTGMEIFQKQKEELEKIMKFNVYVKTLIDNYVPKLLKLHEKMEKLSLVSFDNSLEFHKALTDGFKFFVNQDFQKDNFKVKTSQIFAFYCDEIIRKKDNELDDKFEKIVKFIQFFLDKDLFIEEYRIQLSKRLLSFNEEKESDERNMISKLKRNYRSVSDLYKLEKMLSDKSSGLILRNEFLKFEETKNIPFDFNVNVLTSGTWPISSQSKETFIPPQILLNAQEVFKKFYDTKYERRILNWSYVQGNNVQILGHFSQQKLFDTTTFQASILLVYNSGDEFDFNQLKEKSGLTLDTLKKTLNSLILSKLLIKSGNSDNYENCNFQINSNFEHKSYKIKIQPPRISQQESTKNQLKITQDR
eukprot:gene10859-3478_t